MAPPCTDTPAAVGVVIREATAADLDGLVAMAQHFVQQTSYGAQVPSDAPHLRAVTGRLLEVGCVFVADDAGALVGMIGGLVYPHYLTTRSTASESAWWVEPSARGAGVAQALLAAFEAWAKAQGAKVSEIGSWHQRLDGFYQRLGYTAGERIFRKEL